jgi:threonyl-tRNA synthetase
VWPHGRESHFRRPAAELGEREKHAGAVSVRHRRQADLGGMALDAFIERIQQEIASSKSE